jgi:cellulase/cellobiase CelA1
MAKMVYDPTTKKMIPANEAKAADKGNYVRLSMDGKLADRIVACMTEDGIDTGDSKAKKSNAIRKYVEIAVSEWLDTREAIAEPATETEVE